MNIPPLPVGCIFGEPIPRGGGYERRVLRAYSSADVAMYLFQSRRVCRTKSNAATLRLPPPPKCSVLVCSVVYLPMTRDLLTILHVTLSGFFCDAGVKNEATALPKKSACVGEYQPQGTAGSMWSNSLVVVDSTLRFNGGGETAAAGEADLFIPTTPAALIL